MYTFLIVIHIFASLVLIFVILMQAGRGGGVSEAFGGSSTQTIFGTSATKFLMRATAACAVLFIITSLSLAVLSSRHSRSLMELDRASTIEGGKTKEVEETKKAEETKAEESPQEEVMPTENEEKPIESKSE